MYPLKEQEYSLLLGARIKCIDRYVCIDDHCKLEIVCTIQGFHQVWYQGIVKATGFGVLEDLMFLEPKLKLS